VSRTHFLTTVGLIAFLLIAGTFLALGQHGGVEAVAPAADAMSIDMDTTGNTASSLGTRDECVSVAAGSTVTVDVTIDNIPTYVDNAPLGVVDPNDTGGITAFAYDFVHPGAPNFTIQAPADSTFILTANVGSSTFDASNALPDSSGVWTASVLDVGSAAPEEGSGVLTRLTIAVDAATPAGLYSLSLANHAHSDPAAFYVPDVTNGATLAVGQSCPQPPVDVEMVSLSLTSLSGPTVNVVTNFTMEAQGQATNNGPNPADIEIVLDISVPGDCSKAPNSSQTEAFPAVPALEGRTSTLSWVVNCSQPSSHQFDASGSVNVTGLADDTNLANNGPLNQSDTVSVETSADLVMTGVTVDAPVGAATGAPFSVTVNATLHNQGVVTPLTWCST